MIGVHFHVLDEFLTELDLHAEADLVGIHRGIVRATPVYRHTPAGIRRCSVLASFVSTWRTSEIELVHVDAIAGQLWGQLEEDAQVEERRDTMMAAIAAACERHELEVRPGFYEVRS